MTAEYDARIWKPMASTGELRERKYTVQQVAPMLGVSPMSVNRLIHGRQLRAYRIGKGFRIPESALREYLGGAVVGGEE